MKIHLDMVGCRLNQSEIEFWASRFKQAGHELVASAAEADLMVINTCAVTTAADADSRKKIRQAERQGVKRIVATGCYASLRPELISHLPGVELVIPNQRKQTLVEQVLGDHQTSPNPQKLTRVALPGGRKRTRAFIKAQDGCDNRCTFCITRLARGKSVSRPLKEVFADVQSALAAGVQEIVLTGVNLGAWGGDLSPEISLASLLRELVSEFSPPRLRLSSLESWDVGNDLIEAFALPGMCRHIHLPLQAGSDAVLKRMGRKTDTSAYQQVVDRLRSVTPEIAITTDVMVGFPGETEKEFQESLGFIKAIGFAGGHVFRFSPRPGTAAVNLPNPVDVQTARTRSQQMRDAFKQLATRYQKKFLGRNFQVLWEKFTPTPAGWQLVGFSDNYLRISTLSERNLYNQISTVRLERCDSKGLVGVLAPGTG